jgi:iron complex outermembrane receptor protein
MDRSFSSVLRTGISATALVTALAYSLPALAQSGAQAAAPDAVASPISPTIQDVVVTATRNTEKLHDVPVSASLMTNSAVEALTANGQDMRVLAFTMPSLNVETTQGRNFPRFYIRGYGNTDFNPFASQPVSLVLDGVVQENPNLKGFPMFDLADVQVYRGPQGTLFGRNAPAGVVSVQSAAPKLGLFNGEVNLSEATYNSLSLEGAVNVPVSDNLAIRVAMQQQHRDSWVNDPITHSHYGGWNDFAGRIQFLYKPNNEFSSVLNIHGRVLDGADTMWEANVFTPGSNALNKNASTHTIYADQPDLQSSRTLGVNDNITWNLGPVTLHSISGWEKIFSEASNGDIDAGYGAVYAPPSGPGFIPFAVFSLGGINNLDQLTQEFRFTSNQAGPLQYQAGLYYFYENVTAYAIDANGLTGQPTDYQQSRQVNDAAAIYGSASYQLTSALQIRAGLRYTYDHKVFDITKLVNLSYSPTHADAMAHNISWDASATYAVSPDVNLYARIATGFRAPSFGSATAFNGLEVARSETNNSYEAGVKTFLLDHKVSADFDVYYNWIAHQQLTAVGGTNDAVRLINAHRTIGAGAEWAIRTRLTNDLSLNFSGSYNFTRLKDPTLAVNVCDLCTVINPLNASGQALINGNPLPQAPRYIVDGSMRYEHPAYMNSVLFFEPDVSYRSQLNFFLYESKEFSSQGFINLGLRAGLQFEADKYEVSLFCRNCLDRTVAMAAIDFDNLTSSLNDPRIVGAQLSARF